MLTNPLLFSSMRPGMPTVLLLHIVLIMTCGLSPGGEPMARFPDVLQRAADYEAGSRESSDPPRSHTSNAGRSTASGGAVSVAQEELEAHFVESKLEVLCLVEGIDAITSATIQARHS